MFRPSFHRVGLGLAASFALVNGYGQKSNVAEAQGATHSPTSSVSLFLSDVSKEQLTKYLASVGKVNVEPKQIVIKRLSDPNDTFTYEPLFGERAAFRLKAIVTTNDGRTAGIGRVSIMSGELKDEQFEASLVLEAPNVDSKAIVESMDLPTRVKNAKATGYLSRNFWKGRIVSTKVLDRSYPAVAASIVSYAFDDQIVVDGRLCSSEYVDGNGQCTFDRSRVVAINDLPNTTVVESTQNPANENVSTEGKLSTESAATEEVQTECPLCRFMKAGPCKDEFLGWDSCVNGLGEDGDLSVCMNATMAMMRCMRKYEYYDIMTAGTGEKWAAAEAARVEAEKVVQKQQEKETIHTSDKDVEAVLGSEKSVSP